MHNPSDSDPSRLDFSAFPQYKSIFDSKTFWGAVSTGIVAIAPAVSEMLGESLKTGKVSPLSVLKISMLLATTGITIMGRITADTRVYTPTGMPGPDRTESPHYKSIFDSKTFWGAVSTAIVSITPIVNEMISEFQKTGKINPLSVLRISSLLAMAGITIMGRITADTRVYTPTGMPGPDRAEF